MQAEIYWINEKLATMPRPNGGRRLADEIALLKEAGVNVLVSMLEEKEAASLGLEDEKIYCKRNLIKYLNFPVTDHGLPESFEEVYKFVQKLSAYYEANNKIAVHCFAGIGRSSLIACCLLVLKGLSVDEAFQKISEARGYPVPDTREQLEWAYEFAEKFGKK